MSDSLTLSVAICTRNRHEDMRKCLISIFGQQGIAGSAIEILIIDDGDTEEAWLEEVRKEMPSNMELSYHKKKREEAGLLRSRIYATHASRSETLLFLDDDVELEPDYLAVLLETFKRYPDAVGVGGVDQSFSCSLKGRLLMLISGRSRFAPGKLSYSGFASSMNLWNRQKKIFRTEFLHGCNMCFRKSALRDVEPVEWLNGYSLGEDLYLSYLASLYGPMVINPGLKLIHHGSPASRDKEELVAYTKVINHYELLKLRTGRLTPFRYAMLLWTTLFLYAETAFKRRKEASTGYLRGIRELRSVLARSGSTGV
ncbi:glycosyltransferase family 2 protein [Paenibacillus sp. 7124]|uniref:Glycosyltransferase family 2 protein n=1 Tax=Paenibacillus apii TaxID=1850370 RepID=A0A6M1PPC8_9BACL|nr:glycosyltransferase family 2 protein [Paenibacillus apii]NGM85036.1 glycosyltransferase family 2 protein [Paenibacillus apii]NJJ38504.1 glycosyltransferase family 2 protein [Paenibacillus apii]